MNWASMFFSRLGKIVTKLCDQPEHLQRIAIMLAGAAMYPMVWGLVFIVWRGFDQKVHGTQQLTILGNALLGSMVLWGLVVVALIGIVRGLHAKLPGGGELDLDLGDKDKEDEPSKSA